MSAASHMPSIFVRIGKMSHQREEIEKKKGTAACGIRNCGCKKLGYICHPFYWRRGERTANLWLFAFFFLHSSPGTHSSSLHFIQQKDAFLFFSPLLSLLTRRQPKRKWKTKRTTTAWTIIISTKLYQIHGKLLWSFFETNLWLQLDLLYANLLPILKFI